LTTTEALKLFEKYETIIIHRHKNPDGDAIGSQVGLKLLLKENFPDKKIYSVGDPANRYSFVEGSETDVIDDSVYNGALAVILDSSAKALVSDDRYALAETTLRIDHHLFCENVADYELADPSFESCCGLIAFLAREWNWKMPKKAAQALFTGLATDSGRFRYDSTTERTFLIAAYLCSNGAEPDKIYNELYAEDFSQVKLRAEFTGRVKFTSHNVAYLYNEKDYWQKTGLDSFAVSRGMVGVMSDLKGVYIWINMTETDEGILCEIRSNRYEVVSIARAHGGGGHAKACGCTVKTKEEAEKILKELDEIILNEN